MQVKQTGSVHLREINVIEFKSVRTDSANWWTCCGEIEKKRLDIFREGNAESKDSGAE